VSGQVPALVASAVAEATAATRSSSRRPRCHPT